MWLKNVQWQINYSSTTMENDTKYTEAKIMYQISYPVYVATTHNPQKSRVTVQGAEWLGLLLNPELMTMRSATAVFFSSKVNHNFQFFLKMLHI